MKMDNSEISSMKDDLYMLGYELQETRDGETLKNTIDYINYLEAKIVQIANSEDRAINLLKDKGYVVKNLTKGQIKDSKECNERNNRGEDMDCTECRCSCCIMQ